MNNSLSLFLNDLSGALHSINVADLTMPLGFLLWTSILLMPLWGIDRRDTISAATYSLFCVGAGVLLVFALPQAFTEPIPLKSQVIVTFAMAGIASLRWTLTWNHLFKRQKLQQRSFDAEDEEFGRRSAEDSAANAAGSKRQKAS